MTWSTWIFENPLPIVLMIGAMVALYRGDVVLGREYKDLKEDLDKAMVKLDTITAEQKDKAAEERAAFQAEIDHLKQQLGRREGHR